MEERSWHNDLRLQRRPILVIGPTPVQSLFSGLSTGSAVEERKYDQMFKLANYEFVSQSGHVCTDSPDPKTPIKKFKVSKMETPYSDSDHTVSTPIRANHIKAGC